MAPATRSFDTALTACRTQPGQQFIGALPFALQLQNGPHTEPGSKGEERTCGQCDQAQRGTLYQKTITQAQERSRRRPAPREDRRHSGGCRDASGGIGARPQFSRGEGPEEGGGTEFEQMIPNARLEREENRILQAHDCEGLHEEKERGAQGGGGEAGADLRVPPPVGIGVGDCL